MACGILLAGSPLAAQTPDEECTGPASGVRYHVTVEGLRSSRGQVAVTLYSSDRKRFLVKKGSLYTGRVTAVAPRTRMCIHVPTAGTYAFAIYHDENANEKFDRSGLGFPKEGYGFSNNPSTLFGLPNFSSVLIHVPAADGETTIKMKYP